MCLRLRPQKKDGTNIAEKLLLQSGPQLVVGVGSTVFGFINMQLTKLKDT